MERRHEHRKPLEAYKALGSAKDKHSFWRDFRSDNKFTWLSVQETQTYSKSAKEEHIEGWLSRYQVAAEEKLPPDSALLQELLDQLTNLFC